MDSTTWTTSIMCIESFTILTKSVTIKNIVPTCENNHLGCSIQSDITHPVYPGETFTVSVFASSRNGNFPVTIRAHTQHKLDSNLADPQYAQQAYANTCTLLDYTVFSLSDTVMLELYGDGPCSSLFSYKLNVRLNQNCPPGFNISETQMLCMWAQISMIYNFMQHIEWNYSTWLDTPTVLGWVW